MFAGSFFACPKTEDLVFFLYTCPHPQVGQFKRFTILNFLQKFLNSKVSLLVRPTAPSRLHRSIQLRTQQLCGQFLHSGFCAQHSNI